MAFIIPQPPTIGQSLGQALQNALPGLVAGAQQRRALSLQQQQQAQQQQALQQLGQQFGINFPQDTPIQLGQTILGQAAQQAFAPQASEQFTLGPGQQRFDELGRPIAAVAPTPQARGPVTLSPGQVAFDPQTGQPIASVAERPEAPKPRAGELQVAREGDPSGLPAGTVFQADPQGNVNIISEAGQAGALDPADKAKLAVAQSKEFRTDKRVQDLQIIERSERGMEAALRQSKTAKSRIASDQALGVLFQKMLDPTSVVRESEFARTPQGASIINRMQGAAEQLVKGGLKLKDEDREALVEMGRTLLLEAKKTANTAFDEFDTRATELGLNKKVVFGGRKKFDIDEEPDFDLNLKRPNAPLSPQEETRRQELLRKAAQ
jgi:hypothetical protein